MTPQAAARQLLTLILRMTFHDPLMIADPVESPIEKEQKAAFQRLERETRKSLNYSTAQVDMDALYDAVLASVPEAHRGPLKRALVEFDNGRVADTVVRQEVYYRLGLEVRGLLSEQGARLLGGEL